MSYSLLWAKTKRNEPDTFHSLLFHSIDTAAVALELIRNRFSEGKIRLWKEAFPAVPGEECIKQLAFISSLHDIGKATPMFQEKNKAIKGRLLKAGFQFGFLPENINIYHNTCSQKILRRELFPFAKNLFEEGTFDRITKAIGGHHGEFSNAGKLRNITDRVLGKDEWMISRRILYENLYELLELRKPEEPLKISASVKPLALQYWLTGFITLCDWIASIEEYFPYECETGKISSLSPQAYFNLARSRAVIAFERIGFASFIEQGPLPGFSRMFHGYEARVQQSEALNCIKDFNLQSAPNLLIIEAPMGIGKTEIAFTASEMISLARKHTGTYIAMPTQATSNQMYLRYKDFLEKRLPPGYKADFELLHSASELFISNIQTHMLPAEIFQDIPASKQAELEAHAWFRSKKRGLLAPFAVGTIDQALISVIRTKHNYLRLYGLSAKTIIFDEVHSYDVYMSAILQRLLEWAGALDISVILLSATLPKIKRNCLIEAFTGKKNSNDISYPRITLASKEKIISVPLTPPAVKRIILSENRFDDNDSIIDFLVSKTTEGGCIAVICNTVSKAQQLYKAFISSPGSMHIPGLLLHSRFPSDIRNEIENKVINYFGKTGERPASMVLFSTQIIEQSLDLDFDYLISDLCPIDLLFQRIGRLFRFAETIRPQSFSRPEIAWMSNGTGFFHPENTRPGPYSQYIMLKTQLILQSIHSISIPDDIEPLIEIVYGEANMRELPEEASELLMQLWKTFKDKTETEGQKAEQKLIPPSCTEEEQFFDDRLLLDDEDPSAHMQILASTRLADPSVRVVCIEEKEGNLYLMNKRNDPFIEEQHIDDDMVRSILGAVVPLSGAFVSRSVLNCDEMLPPKAWERYSALRFLRVIRFKDGCFDCGSLKINYSSRLGVYYGNKLNHEEK